MFRKLSNEGKEGNSIVQERNLVCESVTVRALRGPLRTHAVSAYAVVHVRERALQESGSGLEQRHVLSDRTAGKVLGSKKGNGTKGA